MSTRKKKCLIEGCKQVAKFRGLCLRCYRTAWRHVRHGKTSWPELERSGLAKKPSAERQTAMTRKLEQAR